MVLKDISILKSLFNFYFFFIYLNAPAPMTLYLKTSKNYSLNE